MTNNRLHSSVHQSSPRLSTVFNAAIKKQKKKSRHLKKSTEFKAIDKTKNRPLLSTDERAELVRLSSMLPANLRVPNPSADPISVIENTTHYIHQLTATVFARVQNGTLPREILGSISPVTDVLLPRLRQSCNSHHIFSGSTDSSMSSVSDSQPLSAELRRSSHRRKATFNFNRLFS